MPAEAAVWREQGFTLTEELLAQLLERVDAWERTRLKFRTTKPGRSVQIPAPVQIVRPGQKAPERKIETDPRTISAWFANNVGGR